MRGGEVEDCGVREGVGAAVGGGQGCVLEKEGGVGTKTKKFFLV